MNIHPYFLSVVAGVMGNPAGYKGGISELSEADTIIQSGYYRFWNDFEGENIVEVLNLSPYILQRVSSQKRSMYRSSNNGGSIWQPWSRIDNFGYNSLAELAGGVEEVIRPMLALDAADLGTLNLDDVRKNAFFGNSSATGMAGFPSGFDTNYHWFGFSYFFTGDIRGFQFIYTGDTNKAYIRYYSDSWAEWSQL